MVGKERNDRVGGGYESCTGVPALADITKRVAVKLPLII